LVNKIGIVSLVCPKNRVDSEVMLGLLKDAGFSLVHDPGEADAIIVNTCGFIGPAKDESIEVILEYSKYKISGTCKLLIVTGCMAQRYPNELMNEIPEIDAILGTGNHIDLLKSIELALNGTKPIFIDGLNRAIPQLQRVLTTQSGTAYLKISEGCDNHCSYCVIPSLRGRFRSRPMEGLIDEARLLVESGVREIVLIGQDITKYGRDLYEGNDLTVLLTKLTETKGLKWIRLMYLYPDRINGKLLDLINQNEKICNYLDIPIQHISSGMLEKMNRNFSPMQIRTLLTEIRNRIPGVILRTSLITGFPGETQEDFDELSEFVKEYKFNHLGVFCFSSEEGTPAAEFPDQIHDLVKEERRSFLMTLQKKIVKAVNKTRLNEVCEVLIEDESSENMYVGRSYAEAPSVDGQIYVLSNKTLRKGEFVSVKITKTYDYDLLAETYESSK